MQLQVANDPRMIGMGSPFDVGMEPNWGRRLDNEDDYAPLGERPSVSLTPTLYRWLKAGSTSQQTVQTRRNEPDPYLLVLLADQEAQEKRIMQAHSLIEAAYAAYDQYNLNPD